MPGWRSGSFCSCDTGGLSVLMNRRVGSVCQVPSWVRSSSHACTSAPMITPEAGTAAPTTTRAGTPRSLAISAMVAAYCSSSPAGSCSGETKSLSRFTEWPALYSSSPVPPWVKAPVDFRCAATASTWPIGVSAPADQRSASGWKSAAVGVVTSGDPLIGVVAASVSARGCTTSIR